MVVALGMAALGAVQKGERGWMRQGYGGPGPITWRDEPRPPLQLRTVTVKESEMADHCMRTVATPTFNARKR